jgi:hypothetical protein
LFIEFTQAENERGPFPCVRGYLEPIDNRLDWNATDGETMNEISSHSRVGTASQFSPNLALVPLVKLRNRGTCLLKGIAIRAILAG